MAERDPRPDRRRHPGDPRSPLEAPRLRGGHRGRRRGGVGRRSASRWRPQLQPDVVLMDINMPGMDGITATEQLVAEVPDRRGRDDVGPGRGGLPPPLDARRRARVPRQAVQLGRADGSIRQVYAPGAARRPAGWPSPVHRAGAPSNGRRRERRARPVVAVFGPKGGVGRTTLAVNLAVAAATELGQRSRSSTASFQFGDVGVLLNLNPKNKSIADLVARAARRRHRVARDTSSSTTRRHPGAARAAEPGDGRAHHARPASSAMIEALRADARPGHRRLHVDLQRHDARHPRPGGPVLTMLIARDHVDQEHPPLPRGGRAARVRRRQDPARPQSRRFVAAASASRTWSTRSGGGWTTRSSPTAAASSTPSTGACRSSSSNREAQVVPGRPAARLGRGRRDRCRRRRRAQPKAAPEEVPVRVAHDAAARTWPSAAEGE